MHFPVISSVLSATQLSSFLREHYALGINSRCQLLKTFVNDTYLVTDEATRFIFRVYCANWRSEQEILEEIRLIHLLQKNNIGVSYALADASGKYIQKLNAPEGNRFGVLFSFANGKKNYDLSAEGHFRVGAILAKMQLSTVQLTLRRINYTANTLLVDSFEKFQSYLPEQSDERRFMLSAQQYLLREFDRVNTESIRKGAVHLDIWADNLHVDDRMNITLFDFDFCGNGWLCYDVAFYLLMLYSSESGAITYQKKAASFLSGYESVTTLSDEEKRMLPVIGASLCFFYLGVQSERFATVFFNAEHLKRYVHFRVKKWLTFNGIIL